MEGKGRLIKSNGYTYTGDFHSNRRHGEGMLESPEGIYTGKFSQNKFDGHGIMKYSNGDNYDGEWINGCRNGHGKGFFKQPGILYDGDWEKDKVLCKCW